MSRFRNCPFPCIATDEVRIGFEEKKPLVALESTVIAHGLPHPDNINTAKAMEDAVRESGAVPVTLAVLDGVLHAGLDDDQMKRVAEDKSLLKLSRRDISYVFATKKSGATTVSATMMLSHMLGIKVFATGGIGGVHRFAEETFDISADLDEFTKTPVLVVCSGAKSILDLPKTLEYLETKGVPVLCYQTERFPAFYSSTSPLPAPLTVSTIEEVSKVAAYHFTTHSGGIVLANPIPKQDSISFDEVESWIQLALNQAKQKQIVGKAVTPFLLGKLKEISNGRTLDANKALLINNARLAGKLAMDLAGR